MATDNLKSRTLGSILTQVGNGTPDHTAPKGSRYVDEDTGISYKNTDGGTTWADEDQISDVGVETAYNNQVAEVSQGDAEAGISTTIKRWTPERVKQAIIALGGGGGGDSAVDGGNSASNYGATIDVDGGNSASF